MKYEKEFKEWWDKTVGENDNWTTLERLAAHDAYQEARQISESQLAEAKEENARLLADYMKISRAETDLFEALDIIIGFFEIGIIEIKAIKDEVDVNAIIKDANKAISLSCETHEYIRKMKGKRRKQEKGEE